MTEIPLLRLTRWFEENANTPTLSIIRRVVQGFFPELPNTQIVHLGKEQKNIEGLRQLIGEHDFEEYVACQCEGYKRSRNETGEGFYVGYLLGITAIQNVEKYSEKISQRTYQTMESEVYRNCYTTECDILRQYFEHFLFDPKIDFKEIRLSFAEKAQPLWVYHALTLEDAKMLGEDIYKKWTSGRTRVASKKLGMDKLEYIRAGLQALVATAQQISPIAREFMISPDSDEFPIHLQVAFQFLERRDEFMKETSPFSVTLDTEKMA